MIQRFGFEYCVRKCKANASSVNILLFLSFAYILPFISMGTRKKKTTICAHILQRNVQRNTYLMVLVIYECNRKNHSLISLNFENNLRVFDMMLELIQMFVIAFGFQFFLLFLCSFLNRKQVRNDEN